MTERDEGEDQRPDTAPHVLVVDDDADLRDVLERGLRARGFTVVSAGNAGEALGIASDPRVRIDVVVMDLVLPDSWGSQAAMEQSLFRPEAPVIFISGYSRDDTVFQATTSREIHFLAKPFGVDELAELIRRVLGS